MKITEDVVSQTYLIKDYADDVTEIYTPDRTVIHCTGHFVLSPRQLIQDLPAFSLARIPDMVVKKVVEMQPDVLIVVADTFKQRQAVMRVFADIGIGVEIMPHAPACGTFNLLVAESRTPVMLHCAAA